MNKEIKLLNACFFRTSSQSPTHVEVSLPRNLVLFLLFRTMVILDGEIPVRFFFGIASGYRMCGCFEVDSQLRAPA